VDTGAVSLVINEDICRKLGLAIKTTRTATLADGGTLPSLAKRFMPTSPNEYFRELVPVAA
jgi:hypothetical protein